MSKEKRCYGCMKIKTESGVCPWCGYDENDGNAEHQLPAGTVLKEQYLIGKVLGQGGFGITYMGWDLYLDIPVAIKEYFPSGQVMRNSRESTEVISYSGDAGEHFQKNKDRFMREARMLARFSDVPEVVQVKTFFLANNTAYIVMEYLSGITLKNLVESKGPLPCDTALRLLAPVIRALKTVHRSGLIHRDISPDNIMLQELGRVKLLDFGAGRDVGDRKQGQLPTRSTEAILKQGYAPLEQYQGRGHIGAWTDVYALCATLYYCITGEVPPDAPERILGEAELSFEKEGLSIPDELQEIISAGMQLRIEDRIEDMNRLYKMLEEKGLISEKKPEPIEPKEGRETVEAEELDEPVKTGESPDEPEPVTEEEISVPEKQEDKSWDKFLKAGAFLVIAAMVILVCVIGIQNWSQRNTAEADTIQAEIDAGNYIVEGRCGPYTSFRLNLKSGRMHIYGNGDTWDFATEEEAAEDPGLTVVPWNAYKQYIKAVDLGMIYRIGDRAFEDCENLTEVEWGQIGIISYRSFYNTGLESVELPSCTELVGWQAFYGCRNLRNVILPENLRIVEVGALAGTPLETVQIGMFTELQEDEGGSTPFWLEATRNHDPVICSYAGSAAQEFAQKYEMEFQELSWLEDKVLKGQCGDDVYWSMDPASRTLTLTGFGATWDYETDLEPDPNNGNWVSGYPEWYEYRLAIEKVRIRGSVTRIGASMFRDCENLTFVSWGNVKELAVISFLNTGLVSVELPEGLELVENSVFAYCQNLEEIIFPESLVSLDKNFLDCPNLKKFVIKGNPNLYLENSGGEDYFWSSSEEIPESDVVVYGYRGSSAQMLAQEEGVPFIALDE